MANLTLKDVISVRTKFSLTGKTYDEEMLNKVINFIANEYFSTQIEETRNVSWGDALSWIASHAVGVFSSEQGKITSLPYPTPYFTTLNLIESHPPRTLYYLDKFGNRLHRDEDGYVIKNFYHRGYIAQGIKSRINTALGIDTTSELIYFIIDDTMKYLHQLRDIEREQRNEFIQRLKSTEQN